MGTLSHTAAVAVLLLLASSSTPSAYAHPSDFETLTVDLIIGSRGLESVDAAVVESPGPGYEPFPSVALRRRVAERVVGSLGLRPSDASIDPANSARYHEAGFVVSVSAPRPGRGSILRVDTRSLQEITGDLGLARLKLSVCGVDGQAFDAIDVAASRAGRPPLPASQERPACEVWDLDPAEPPVEIVVSSDSRPSAGLGAGRLVAISAALLLVGLAATAVWRMHRQTLR